MLGNFGGEANVTMSTSETKKTISIDDGRGNIKIVTEVKTTIDRGDGSKPITKVHYENKDGKVIKKPDYLNLTGNITDTGSMSETGENGKARGVSNR